MFNNFYDSFHYLNTHPIFNHKPNGEQTYYSFFNHCLDVDVQKVNPANGIKEDDESLNTQVEIWLEAGPFISEDIISHDVDLDCGGYTYEQAIINLANLVYEKYSSDKETALKIVQEQYQ